MDVKTTFLLFLYFFSIRRFFLIQKSFFKTSRRRGKWRDFIPFSGKKLQFYFLAHSLLKIVHSRIQILIILFKRNSKYKPPWKFFIVFENYNYVGSIGIGILKKYIGAKNRNWKFFFPFSNYRLYFQQIKTEKEGGKNSLIYFNGFMTFDSTFFVFRA